MATELSLISEKSSPGGSCRICHLRAVHREDVFVDRSEQEDEQRLREIMCERRSVGICCHDSPHGEAVEPPVRAFHTVSARTSGSVKLYSWVTAFGQQGTEA